MKKILRSVKEKKLYTNLKRKLKSSKSSNLCLTTESKTWKETSRLEKPKSINLKNRRMIWTTNSNDSILWTVSLGSLWMIWGLDKKKCWSWLKHLAPESVKMTFTSKALNLLCTGSFSILMISISSSIQSLRLSDPMLKVRALNRLISTQILKRSSSTRKNIWNSHTKHSRSVSRRKTWSISKTTKT